MTIHTRLTRSLSGYSALIVLLVTISLVGAGIAVGFRLNRNSERKFCEITESNVIAYRDTPPTTETGKRIAENWINLQHRLHCPVKKG